MILRDRPEQFAGGWKIVLYDVDAAGGLKGELTRPVTHDDVQSYYVQRFKEEQRLIEEIVQGKISPLALFLESYRMTVADLAKRAGLRQGTVKKHLTPKGFDEARVADLRRYARIFALSVADFFAFARLGEGVTLAVADHQDHLVQILTIAQKAEP